jgi:hypothetical protein
MMSSGFVGHGQRVIAEQCGSGGGPVKEREAPPCQWGARCVTQVRINATLEEIHRDPAILDRAILQRERLDIFDGGAVAATMLPSAVASVEEARRVMRERFAAPDWEFSGSTVLTRDERNARG